MAKARRLGGGRAVGGRAVTFGVCATGDPRIDKASRSRAVNITEMVANVIAGGVKMPDGGDVNVVWSPVLIDGEKQADQVARQFAAAGVDAVVCAGYLGLPSTDAHVAVGPDARRHARQHHLRQQRA